MAGGFSKLLRLVGLGGSDAPAPASGQGQAASAMVGRWRLAPYKSGVDTPERIAENEASTLTAEKVEEFFAQELYLYLAKGGFADLSLWWPVPCADGAQRLYGAMIRVYPPGVRDDGWGLTHDGDAIAIRVSVQGGARRWVMRLSGLMGAVIASTRDVPLPADCRVRSKMVLPADSLFFGLEFADGSLVPIAEIGRGDARARGMLEGWATAIMTLRDGARPDGSGLRAAIEAIEAPGKQRRSMEYRAKREAEEDAEMRKYVADKLASWPPPVTIGAHVFRAGKVFAIPEASRAHHQFTPRQHVEGEVLKAELFVPVVPDGIKPESRGDLEELLAQTTRIDAATIVSCRSATGEMSDWVDRRTVSFNSDRARYSKGLVTAVKNEADVSVSWSKLMLDLQRIEIFTGREMKLPPEALLRPDVAVDDAALILCLVFKDGEKIPLSYTVKTPRADLEAWKALLEMGWRKQTGTTGVGAAALASRPAPGATAPTAAPVAAPVAAGSGSLPAAASAALARYGIVNGFTGGFASFTTEAVEAECGLEDRWEEPVGALPPIENEQGVSLIWGLPCSAGVMSGFASIAVIPAGADPTSNVDVISVGVPLGDGLRVYEKPVSGLTGFSVVKAQLVKVPRTHLLRADTLIGENTILFALLFEDGSHIPIAHVVDDKDATIMAVVQWAARIKAMAEAARGAAAGA